MDNKIRKKGQRKIQNLLVDKKFQLKYSMLMALIAGALLAVLGSLYVGEKRASSQLLDIDKTVMRAGEGLPQESKQDAWDKEFALELKDEVSRRDTKDVAVLFAIAASLVIVLLLIGVWMTHKAAGPIYASMKMLEALKQGKWEEIRGFRKGDDFYYLGEAFQKTGATLKQKLEVACKQLERAITLVQNQENEQAAEILKSVRDELAGSSSITRQAEM